MREVSSAVRETTLGPFKDTSLNKKKAECNSMVTAVVRKVKWNHHLYWLNLFFLSTTFLLLVFLLLPEQKLPSSHYSSYSTFKFKQMLSSETETAGAWNGSKTETNSNFSLTSSSQLSLPLQILFVCAGNTCRSPMAVALLRRKLSKATGLGLSRQIEVASAGTDAREGSGSNEKTIQVCEEAFGQEGEGHDILMALKEHRATQLVPEHFQTFNLILVMDKSNLKKVMTLKPSNSKAGVYRVGGFSKGLGEGNEEVLDPFGKSIESYRETYDVLNLFLDNFVQTIILPLLTISLRKDETTTSSSSVLASTSLTSSSSSAGGWGVKEGKEGDKMDEDVVETALPLTRSDTLTPGLTTTSSISLRKKGLGLWNWKWPKFGGGGGGSGKLAADQRKEG